MSSLGNKPFLFIRKIWQKDDYTFCIEWNDGILQEFRLSHLQRNCPCAQCNDERPGQRLLDSKTVAEDVRAIFIRSVGHYGLRIQFTSGCSSGIYSFDKLRAICKHSPRNETCSRK